MMKPDEIKKFKRRIVNAMSGFGFKAEDLGRVNDVFAKAANDSAASMRSLAEAFKFIGRKNRDEAG